MAALTFSPKFGKDAILQPESWEKGLSGNTNVLAPPMGEFIMLVTELKSKESKMINAIQGSSIFIVT
jgi:mannose-6-phosphate isomerase